MLEGASELPLEAVSAEGPALAVANGEKLSVMVLGG